MDGFRRSAEVERQRRELVVDILTDELAQVRQHRDSLLSEFGRMPYPSDVESAEVEADFQRKRADDLLAACREWKQATEKGETHADLAKDALFEAIDKASSLEGGEK